MICKKASVYHSIHKILSYHTPLFISNSFVSDWTKFGKNSQVTSVLSNQMQTQVVLIKIKKIKKTSSEKDIVQVNVHFEFI